jgi:hypothetical protein
LIWLFNPAAVAGLAGASIFTGDCAAHRRTACQGRIEMRFINFRPAAMLLLSAPLLLAACASNPPETSSAVATANESKAEADKAMQTAQQALATAQKAEQEAQAANQRADEMYNRTLKK